MGQEQGCLLQAPGVRAALARLNGLEWLQANEMPRLCRTALMFAQVPSIVLQLRWQHRSGRHPA